MPVQWLHVNAKHDSLTLTKQRHGHSDNREYKVVMGVAPFMLAVSELRCEEQEHVVTGEPLGPS